MSGENSTTPEHLLQRIREHDRDAVAEVFALYRKRLKRMVQLRLDRRLQGRVDPSDVLQEAYLYCVKQLPNYAKDPKLPFYLWLRRITGQRLTHLHREHFGAKRNPMMEVSL